MKYLISDSNLISFRVESTPNWLWLIYTIFLIRQIKKHIKLGETDNLIIKIDKYIIYNILNY